MPSRSYSQQLQLNHKSSLVMTWYLTLIQHVKTHHVACFWKLVEQLTARALGLPKNWYTAVVAETLPVFGEDQLDHSWKKSSRSRSILTWKWSQSVSKEQAWNCSVCWYTKVACVLTLSKISLPYTLYIIQKVTFFPGDLCNLPFPCSPQSPHSNSAGK